MRHLEGPDSRLVVGATPSLGAAPAAELEQAHEEEERHDDQRADDQVVERRRAKKAKPMS